MGLHLGTPIPASRVVDRLSHNYPPSALNWVSDATWYGPLDVPLASVDFTDADSWAAAHQPGRVRHFAGEKPDDVHPAVLVLEHGDTRAEVVDGHHRALADREDGRPVTAFVGVPPAGDVRWRETHTAQRHQGADAANKAAKPVAAGLAVRAADTGRVLMLQRAANPTHCTCGLPIEWDPLDGPQHADGSISHDDKKGTSVSDRVGPPDPAAGLWELPGGRLDGDETPLQAARREWSEETGMDLPDGEVTGSWQSKDGIYHGFVHTVPHEADVPIHDDRDEVDNPDGHTAPESIAWFDPEEQIKGNPAMRPEVRRNRKRMLRALRANDAPVTKAAHPTTCKCLTCGCHQESAQHADPANITIEDLQAAARAAGISLMQAWANMKATVGQVEPLDPVEKAAFLAAVAGSSDRGLADSATEELRKVDEGEVGDVRARHLHDYWVHGEGLARWVDSPHKWTTLYHNLLEYIHDPEKAKRTAAQWFHDALGYWPGDQRGKNPVGPG